MATESILVEAKKETSTRLPGKERKRRTATREVVEQEEFYDAHETATTFTGEEEETLAPESRSLDDLHTSKSTQPRRVSKRSRTVASTSVLTRKSQDKGQLLGPSDQQQGQEEEKGQQKEQELRPITRETRSSRSRPRQVKKESKPKAEIPVRRSSRLQNNSGGS